jgi:hypothetical protein
MDFFQKISDVFGISSEINEETREKIQNDRQKRLRLVNKEGRTRRKRGRRNKKREKKRKEGIFEKEEGKKGESYIKTRI